MIISLGDISREMGSASSWRIFLLLVAFLQHLEADALRGGVLVDEHQPLLALGHDVKLPDLAQDAQTGHRLLLWLGQFFFHRVEGKSTLIIALRDGGLPQRRRWLLLRSTLHPIPLPTSPPVRTGHAPPAPWPRPG